MTRVVDGDTIEGDIDLGFNIYLKKIKVRIIGINCKETRGEFKEEGIKAADYARKLLEGKILRLSSHSATHDSFGRILADIYFLDYDGDYYSFADRMIEDGYAEHY